MIPVKIEGDLFNSESVLASKKPEVLDKKGKGYAEAKWEAEVRQQLNAKKKTQAILSKQDQALVNEQLQKEAEIRKRVSEIRARLDHGLNLVNSLTTANVEEFRAYAPRIASILRLNVFCKASEALVGEKPFNTFMVSTFISITRNYTNMCSAESERLFVREVGIDPYLDCRCYITFPRTQRNTFPDARRTPES